VFGVPRTRARLQEAGASLPLMLWHAAGMDAAVCGFGGLNATVIDAAEGLLRPLRSLRRFGRRLRMLCCLWLRLCLWLCRLHALWLRLLWCGPALLPLISLLGIAMCNGP